jgi:hypothetical protein
MSGDGTHRLRAVTPADARVERGQVPADVLRLVALPEERRAFLLRVSGLVGRIAYGTVVIVLHEGTITQIETSEKIRLPQRSDEVEEGGGV